MGIDTTTASETAKVALITSVGTLLAILLKWLRDEYIHRRDRREAIEDRTRARKELAERHTQETALVVGQIQENTQISETAFQEANRVNSKVAATLQSSAECAAQFAALLQAIAEERRGDPSKLNAIIREHKKRTGQAGRRKALTKRRRL